jgi:hypothetical protein
MPNKIGNVSVSTLVMVADAALGGRDLRLHRLRQSMRGGERADHHRELVDRAVLGEVQEVRV